MNSKIMQKFVKPVGEDVSVPAGVLKHMSQILDMTRTNNLTGEHWERIAQQHKHPFTVISEEYQKFYQSWVNALQDTINSKLQKPFSVKNVPLPAHEDGSPILDYEIRARHKKGQELHFCFITSISELLTFLENLTYCAVLKEHCWRKLFFNSREVISLEIKNNGSPYWFWADTRERSHFTGIRTINELVKENCLISLIEYSVLFWSHHKLFDQFIDEKTETWIKEVSSSAGIKYPISCGFGYNVEYDDDMGGAFLKLDEHQIDINSFDGPYLGIGGRFTEIVK